MRHRFEREVFAQRAGLKPLGGPDGIGAGEWWWWWANVAKSNGWHAFKISFAILFGCNRGYHMYVYIYIIQKKHNTIYYTIARIIVTIIMIKIIMTMVQTTNKSNRNDNRSNQLSFFQHRYLKNESPGSNLCGTLPATATWTRSHCHTHKQHCDIDWFKGSSTGNHRCS